MEAKTMYLQTRIFLFLVIALTVGGCASGPQYLPKELEGCPQNEIAEFNIDIRTKNVYIGDKKVTGNKVFIPAGTHEISYKVYGETDDWKSAVKAMEENGFVASSDGNRFTKGTTTATPLGISRYGWSKRSKKATFHGGKTYSLSGL